MGLSARDVSLLLHGSAEHCLIPRGLFTDTAQHVRSLLCSFSVLNFLVVVSVPYIKLTYVSF